MKFNHFESNVKKIFSIHSINKIPKKLKNIQNKNKAIEIIFLTVLIYSGCFSL